MRYDPSLREYCARLSFDHPPVHYTRYEDIEDALLDTEYVNSAWIDHMCGVEISYDNDQQKYLAIHNVRAVLLTLCKKFGTSPKGD